MPLMPMPPMPTKCTRRVLPSTSLQPGSSIAGSCRHQLQRAIDDHPRRVGPRQRARRGRHPRRAASRSRGQRQNPLAPARAPVRSACGSTSAAPAARQRLGVLALVIVGRRRQRNRESPPCPPPSSRPASSRRRGRRSRRPVRSRRPMSSRNGSTSAASPACAVGGADHLHISLSRLVRDDEDRAPPAASSAAASTMATLIACAP